MYDYSLWVSEGRGGAEARLKRDLVRCVCVCFYVCVSECVSVCLCVYLYMFVCLFVLCLCYYKEKATSFTMA